VGHSQARLTAPALALMVRQLLMGRSSQTRLASLDTSIALTMVISAHPMVSQERLHALATILLAGARMLGATSTLAAATIQVLVCQITSLRQQVESLCTIHIPLVVVQMGTMLQNARRSQTQLHVVLPMIAFGQEALAQCPAVA